MKKRYFVRFCIIMLAIGLILAGCDLLEVEPPALTGTVTISNTSPRVGDMLTAHYTGNGTGTASWQWYRGDAAIGGATGSYYTVVSADVGKTLKAQVSYTDQKGVVSSEATASALAAILPVITGTVTINNNSPEVGDRLTATYSGGNGLGTHTWQWVRGGDLISSATGSAYTVTGADAGKTLRVYMRSDDRSGILFSTPTNEVIDNRPELEGMVTLSVTAPKVGDKLTATYSGGNGSGDVSWQWLRGSDPIGGATSASYTVAAEDQNKALKAQVSYANQKGSIASEATAAVAAAPGSNYTPVQSIIFPTTTSMVGNLQLTGIVSPNIATNKTIVWSVLTAGTTGATINGSTLKTMAAGEVTIRATIKNGKTASSDFTQDFVIIILPSPQGTVSVPTATLAGGIVTSGQSVTLSTTTDGASIYYTTNGAVPTTSSTQYANPITINQTTILKAIATKSGMNNSEVLTVNYYVQVGSDLPLGDGMTIRNVNDNGGVVVEMKGNPKQITDYKTNTQIRQITQKLYTVFADEFDSIILVMDNDKSYTTQVGNLYGINYRVSNAVDGIGLPIVSDSAAWGSGGMLKSVMAFPYREGISNGPSVHEFAHNWAAFICPTFTVNPANNFLTDYPFNGHWGISNAGGRLGGFKYVRVAQEDSGGFIGKTKYQGSIYPPKQDGSFDDPGFGDNDNTLDDVPYSDIELYCMGMKSAAELREQGFTLDIYTGLSFDVSDASLGYFYAMDKISYTIDDLIALNGNGERTPSVADSQRKFKVLTVFISAEDSPDVNYQSIVSDIKWFANMPGFANSYPQLNFNKATGGKGNLEVTGLKDSLK